MRSAARETLPANTLSSAARYSREPRSRASSNTSRYEDVANCSSATAECALLARSRCRSRATAGAACRAASWRPRIHAATARSASICRQKRRRLSAFIGSARTAWAARAAVPRTATASSRRTRARSARPSAALHAATWAIRGRAVPLTPSAFQASHRATADATAPRRGGRNAAPVSAARGPPRAVIRGSARPCEGRPVRSIS